MSGENTTPRTVATAKILCIQDERRTQGPGSDTCVFCDGTMEQCVAWEDWIEEAEEILAAADAVKGAGENGN